jgi:predicted metal-binding protein
MYTIVCIDIIPVINYKTKSLCLTPYPGHPKGCPNFGKKKTCPPKAPFFEKYFDMDKSFYLIINRFDLRAHVNKLRASHPDWSERQLKCCLYWQGTARKDLKVAIKEFLNIHSGYHVSMSPEAMGLDVTETLRNIGIILEWPPENFVYQVALAGVKRKEK